MVTNLDHFGTVSAAVVNIRVTAECLKEFHKFCIYLYQFPVFIPNCHHFHNGWWYLMDVLIDGGGVTHMLEKE